MSRDELIGSFALEGISGGNAVFDTAKLDWMNGQYIARLPVDALASQVVPLLAEAGLWPPPDERAGSSWLHRLLELLRPRAKRLTDFAEQARPFLVDTVEYDPDAAARHLTAPEVPGHLDALVSALRTAAPFDEPHVEAVVRRTAEERGLKAGALIHTVRVGITGRMTSPGIFESLVILGQDRAVGRLERAGAYAAGQTPSIR
jgi:glutamyl/glutaminyl-tRNA synthetase